ncbi:hypothetical protein [uncultured Flavobacterium sp.]|uniref:hypothetical protein n=1 Tax=uncultured Flavobacterium sp. TaxID=165435 RepID=UPI0025F8625B|nr:hypothetical protein [uncultured Flavobacterium sp.]
MKKYIYLALASVILLFTAYYCWENSYVELHPVVVNEVLHRPVFFSEIFHNQLFKIAETHEVPKYYYKNIKYVLDRESQEYTLKNGEIYIKKKYMNDMELIWNYTTKTSNIEWFKSQKEMDSINGDIESLKELDSIIKNFRYK